MSVNYLINLQKLCGRTFNRARTAISTLYGTEFHGGLNKPISLTIEAFGPMSWFSHIGLLWTSSRPFHVFSSLASGGGENINLRCHGVCLVWWAEWEVRKQMHCRGDFAEPHLMTRVDFSFAIGDAQYRVERLPKQMVAKKRGTGMWKWNICHCIWKRKMVSGGYYSAAIHDTIQQNYRLRKDQFLQVVSIPREFRKLLVASTSEREELLHTLLERAISEITRST